MYILSACFAWLYALTSGRDGDNLVVVVTEAASNGQGTGRHPSRFGGDFNQTKRHRLAKITTPEVQVRGFVLRACGRCAIRYDAIHGSVAWKTVGVG